MHADVNRFSLVVGDSLPLIGLNQGAALLLLLSDGEAIGLLRWLVACSIALVGEGGSSPQGISTPLKELLAVLMVVYGFTRTPYVSLIIDLSLVTKVSRGAAKLKVIRPIWLSLMFGMGDQTLLVRLSRVGGCSKAVSG